MNILSSFLKTNNPKVVTTFTSKQGGIIKLVLFVLAVILLLAYFGITFTDIQENEFIQYLVSLITAFFS